MKKAAKQKNKKGQEQRRQQQRQHQEQHEAQEAPVMQEPVAAAAEQTENTPADTVEQPAVVVDPTATAKQGTEADINTPELQIPAAISEQRALLLAKQKQRPNQWKQQVKAGKMVNAHVPRRFNRGG